MLRLLIFTRIAALLCGVALLMALAADLTMWSSLFLMSRRLGSGGFFLSRPAWLILLCAGWIAALAIGYVIALKLRIFPFTAN
jgi:hypothetical protein